MSVTKSGKAINPEGCRCKSGCISKLCVCSNNGVGCSPICKCISCKNEFVEIDPEEVRQLFKATSRKREKIKIDSAIEKDCFSKTVETAENKLQGKTTFFFIEKADSVTQNGL